MEFTATAARSHHKIVPVSSSHSARSGLHVAIAGRTRDKGPAQLALSVTQVNDVTVRSGLFVNGVTHHITE